MSDDATNKLSKKQADELIELFRTHYIGHGNYVGDTPVFEVIKEIIGRQTKGKGDIN